MTAQPPQSGPDDVPDGVPNDVPDVPSDGPDDVPDVPNDVPNELDLTDSGSSVDRRPASGYPSLRAALEAILMVVEEPVSAVTLAQVLARPVAEVEEELRAAAQSYRDDGRGFELREAGGGWRFYSSDRCADVVERFVLDGQQARLTQAALETLAVVAYRQPVTRARISAVRGVNVDSVVRTLLTRGLIEEAGHEPESGAILYRTTSFFLERMGLNDLDELPPLAPYLPELEALELDSDHSLL